jgi:hypothetical protein
MPIAEDSAGGSPVPIPTNLTTNLTGEATGSGTLDYTTGDIDIAVTVVDNGHNHILSNITDVQVNNAISGQILVYNGTVWANATNTSGITALVQDLSPQLGGNLDLNNRNITGTGNIAITGTIDGRDVSADGTKLDGIESGATADQTAAQIKTAYESNANTNNFADADVSKLSGIEPGATADQTATQIKTAYESNSNTNAFTDADHTKLDGIETAADVTDTTNVVASLTAGTNVTIAADGTISATGGTSGIAHVVDDTTPQLGGNLDLNSHDITGTGNLNFTGSVTLSGTVDGRDVAADGTKLDGIEAGANITDTANVTAAGALMDSEVTNLAQVKAFDSSDYATAAQGTTADAALPKAGGTMTGDILFNDSVKAKYGTSSDLQIYHDASHSYIKDSGTGNLKLETTGGNISLLGGTENMVVATKDGSVSAYYNGNKKLETSASGIDVTGNVVGDGLTIEGDATFTGGGTGSIVINDEDSSLCPTMTFLRNGGGTTTNDFIKFENSGGEVANIDSTGGALFRELKVKGSNTRRIDISNTTLADTGEMATLQWDNSANFTIQGRTSAGGFAANWYSIQTSDTDGRADAHIFYTDASTERMRINSTGVGIGTTSPAHELHIESTSPTIRLVDSDGSNTLDITQSGSASYLTFDNNMRFRNASNVEKLRIDSDGIDVTGKITVASTDPEIFLTDTSTSVTHSIDGNSGVGNLFMHVDKDETGSDPKFVVNVGSQDNVLVAKSTGVEVTGTVVADKMFVEGTADTRQWEAGSAGQKLAIYAYDNSTFYHRLETGNATNYQWGTYDNIPIYTITNNSIKTTLLGNGNFGVGHTSPVAKMAILGSSNSTVTEANSNLCVEGTGGNGMLFGTLSTSGFKSYIQAGFVSNLGTATYDLLLNPEGGNVGVGTLAPTAKIHIKDVTNTSGSTTGSTLLRLDNDVNGDLSQQKTFIDFALYDSNANEVPQVRIGAEVGPNSDASSQEKEGEGAFVIYTNNATTGGTTPTGLNERMRVDYLGNVGIGVTSPAEKLDVVGNIKVSGHINIADTNTKISEGSGNGVRITSNSGFVEIGPQNTSYCHFSTDRTRYYFNQNLVVAGNRVVSSYGGDLLLQRSQSSTQQISIGLSQVVMTGQLNISGANPSSNNGAFEVPVINSSTPAIVSVSAGTTSLRTHHSFENSNGQVGKINTLGTNTIYSTSSDYRLKTDIQPMQGSIDRVKALKPVNFEWITDGTRVDGFIAHEAQEVVPEAIVGQKDAMRDKVNIITPLIEATYDEEGNELTSEIPAVTETEQVPDYQGIDQSKIVPLLTSALQDAIAKIEALETRLTALES